MKVYILCIAVLIICTGFFFFQIGSDRQVEYSELIKSTANNAADAAALFYDKKKFSHGVKVYDKDAGNQAIAYIIKDNLNLTERMTFRSPYFSASEPIHYHAYYFDGDGKFTIYRDGSLQSSSSISYPYLFQEEKTGYKKTITVPTVIVTINAGSFKYQVQFIKDPDIIRTSGYEYKD